MHSCMHGGGGDTVVVRRIDRTELIEKTGIAYYYGPSLPALFAGLALVQLLCDFPPRGPLLVAQLMLHHDAYQSCVFILFPFAFAWKGSCRQFRHSRRQIGHGGSDRSMGRDK